MLQLLGSRDFLFHLDHAYISFALVVVKRLAAVLAQLVLQFLKRLLQLPNRFSLLLDMLNRLFTTWTTASSP